MAFVNVEMKNSKYPYDQGWIKATYTLTTDKQLTEDEAKRLSSWGKPDDYEFGDITQRGKKLVVFQRNKKKHATPAQ